MTVMTIAAIVDNPANAVILPVPTNPDRLLLNFAFRAALYCRDRDELLMQAARAGTYTPANWTPEDDGPDIHEEIEARWFSASTRVEEIAALFDVRFDDSLIAELES